MRYENPSHCNGYRLIATKKYKSDIGLIVMCPGRREYSWRNVPQLHNEELKNYLLSLSEGIELGKYDDGLLDKEVERLEKELGK